ncbi:double-strand break repair protein AddB [Siculibacillus lacustris]|uniref:Double-strand break repair protein AddB n=1 Tax=Siculibacillus lacustris TaxID=1549641 RepID=A0A4Q9VUF8_9HYPH|nr:double-strand break repair protein AddB [Siculibacillus lacustris]
MSIDAGRPFLATLARAFLDGTLVPGTAFDPADPTAMADALILVPTRRAARALRDALLAELAAGGGEAVALLPEIRPFGDVDEDGDFGEADDDLAPVATPLERRLAMTRLVLGWTAGLAAGSRNPATGAAPTVPATPAEAVRLASALLVLMDQVVAEGADWSLLDGLVPEDHAAWWQLTRDFLAIATRAWPAHLAERGLDDPAVRRHAAIRRTARRLAEAPPKGPVIAAGSTGSVPSTAELIAVVSRLETGAVVLPGLDFDLDAAAWDSLEPETGDPVPGHPQYGLRLLLDRLGVTRDDVARLGAPPTPNEAARRRLLSEALRPAATTQDWRTFAAAIAEGRFDLPAALAGVGLIEARNDAEEALAVALVLREAIEDPAATAALVTPDRNLARRVAAELGRWGLEIDDSAGRPFGHTRPAVLARLIAETALGGFDPVTVAALLAHPLARFGRRAAAAARLARVIELIALRGPRTVPTGAGLIEAFDEAAAEIAAHPGRTAAARARIRPAERAEARALLVDLVDALAPLEALGDRATVDLPTLVATHVAALGAIAADADGSDAALYADEDGEALAAALAGLVEAAASEGAAIRFAAAAWPGFFEALLGDVAVNRRTAPGARLFVYGPLEARLLSFDLVVLAGLDEGIWPVPARADPWLSRPMRRDLALEAPERRIGLSAHDFAQAAAAPRVILARAARAGGSPTVPSRWLQRLSTLIGAAGTARIKAPMAAPLAWARRIDRPDAPPRAVARPSPRPPVALRPNRLSITEIETWIRDPYAIFARHVLRLTALDPLGRSIGAAERGTFVHDTLAAFLREGTSVRGAVAPARLSELAEIELARFAAFPEVVALWRPRLAAIGRWWLAVEAERDPLVAERHAEIAGRWVFPVDGVDFTLSGRADRIDLMTDGRLALLDYKTGRPPSEKAVQALMAPQLPLEAAMVRAGAFGPDLVGKAIAEIAYLHLTGGAAGGSWESRGRGGTEARDAEALADAARDRLEELVRLFRRPETGYPSRPRVQFEKDRGGDYDHLARVAEWAAGTTPEATDP